MKILIAEDEYYARQRLIKIIRECDMEAELAAAVENGRGGFSGTEYGCGCGADRHYHAKDERPGAGGIYPCEHALYTGGYCIRL
jgi:hypothetical protein